MEYISLKGVEKPVSRICMGTAWFRPHLEDEIFMLLDAYLDKGGNCIDTGRFYGASQAESILKKYFESRGNRDQVILVDKCCHPIVTPDMVHCFDYWRVKPDLMEDDLYFSLYNTGSEFFDLYLLHRDDPAMPVGDLMDRMEYFVEKGLIGAYGVSNWELSRVAEALKYCEQKGYRGLSVNSPSFSLAQVRKPRWYGCVYADHNYAMWHMDKELPLYCWSSQGNGFFAEAFPFDQTAPKDVQEAYYYEDNFTRLDRARELGRKYGVAPINIALAYVLRQPFPTLAIVGPRNRDELSSCLRSLEIPLSEQEINYLRLEVDSY
ncbi:MAG: aldo/keto reductase [Peptococcaceae bacterium]|jgi:aryl-alcohol dehydrogenase-like predicted oxidoreductase|nr:aldo/keto reductase [Peptococcaceae bacterium]